MRSRHFALLFSALVLVLHVTAQPRRPETNGNETQFERETNIFIRDSYTKNFLNFVVELQTLYTKVVKDLSQSEHQTPMLKELVAYITLALEELEKYVVNGTQQIEIEFIKKVKPLSKMLRLEKNDPEQPVELQLVAEALDKYGRQSVKNSFESKQVDLVEQVTDRLKGHFEGLSEKEGQKEAYLYCLYDNFKHNRSPTEALKNYIRFIFESFYYSKND